MTPCRVATAAVLGLLSAPAVHAHSFGSGVGDFYAGVLHPLTAVEHLLVWLVVALWAGQREPGEAHRSLIAFPSGLLLGGLLGRALSAAGPAGVVQGSGSELAFVTMLLGGLAVAFELAPSRRLFLGLVAAAAVPQGYANTVGLDPGVSLVVYLLGLLGVALVLFFVVVEGALAARGRPAGRIAVRVLGSWVAAVGLLAGAHALRGG